MQIELFGMARELIGEPRIDVEIETPATVDKLIDALARSYPQLLGIVIDHDRSSLVEPNVLLLDGRRSPGRDELFDERDRPCLLFVPSGG
jgi:molybdopterin converting factor small subunit